MNKIAFLAAMAIMSIGASAQVPVFLTAGQSNTDGRVPSADFPKEIADKGYEYCQWSYCNGTKDTVEGKFEKFYPRMSSDNDTNRWTYDAITYYLIEKALQKPFYVIKQAHGGTSIDPACLSSGRKGAPGNGFHWSSDSTFLAENTSVNHGGNSLLKAFTDNIGKCIDEQLSQLPEGYEIKAWMWHQGESDAKAADRYHDNLKAMVEFVRQYLVEKTGNGKYATLPFICGTVPGRSARYRADIENAFYMLQAEDPNFHVVSLFDAELQKDRLHFVAPVAIEFGAKVYNKMVEKGIIDGAPVDTSSELFQTEL